MKRDMLVAVVIVVAGAVALAAGIYLVSVPAPPKPPPPILPVPEWKVQLERGLTYSQPVIGPTTPLNDANGGLWVINAAREGIIQMNLTGYSLGLNESPFLKGDFSLRRDIARDFGETGAPLEAVYYIVPALDYVINGSTGPLTMNGAIAFFAGQDFVVVDPFNTTILYRTRLPFPPTWTGEDPASAGELLIAPRQPSVTVGVISFPVGPYRYFWASDGNHTAVFELTYVHAGYCPCAAASGSMILSSNAALSAPPFVSYNEFGVTQNSSYRTGPGAAILLPLANHTLEILNTVPAVRGWVPLRLGGEPAEVAGDIGFLRTPFPYRLLIPLRSASFSGLVSLDLASLTTVFESTAGDSTWQLVGPPLSYNGEPIFSAWYSSGDNRTRFVGLNATGVAIPQFSATLAGRVRSVFQVSQMNEIFAQAQDGHVVTLATYLSTSANVTPLGFPLSLPSTDTVVLYAGSPGGTRYGTLLSAWELRGAWTDPANATTALFQLVIPAPPPQTAAQGAAAEAFDVSTGAVAALAVVPCGVSSGRRT